MNEQKPISHIIAGLLISGVLIIFSLVLYLTNTKQGGINNIIPFILIIAELTTITFGMFLFGVDNLMNFMSDDTLINLSALDG